MLLIAVAVTVGVARLGGDGRAAASIRHVDGGTRGVGARAVGVPAHLTSGAGAGKRPAPVRGGHWVATWGASPQAPIAGNLSDRGFAGQTVRQIVFSSVEGAMARVRLSNAFGGAPLRIARASIAVQRHRAELDVGTVRALSFGGRPSAVISAGGELTSDPVALRVRPGLHLAVSLYLRSPTGPVTQHTQARQVNYLASGGHALDAGARAFTAQTESWYVLTGVDVLAPPRDRGAVVAFGDSITDGVGAPLNANARYPNALARRFAARRGPTLSAIDEGIGGNRVLSATACCGVPAVSRFRRDVLGQPGVREVIVLEGVNDIGQSQSRGAATAPHTAVSAGRIVDGYARIIAMAHAAGLKVFGATLTPFRGARYWTPAGEAKREAVNRWIRVSGAFDGLIDFAAAVAQPGHPERLAPAFDSGDHLHPDAAGYRAMARAVRLGMLLRGA
ncbi:MAG TPA: SGNH/GDSL hydrolase family protein [Solirubrobacteraceae bacterium]